MAVLLMSLVPQPSPATFLLFHRCPPFPFRYLQNISLTFTVQAVLLKCFVVVYSIDARLLITSNTVTLIYLPHTGPTAQTGKEGSNRLKSEHSR